VLCVPLAGRVPLHAPAALQAVALVEVQLKVAELPASMVVADAFNDTAGTGTVPGPDPAHAVASKTDPAINNREIERTDIPS
jgi:predicted alternative tryptophan synthase beta-subunit